MGKIWVLDTDTKGTGAQMVPLDKALEERTEPASGSRERPRRPIKPRGSTAEAGQRPRSPSRKPTEKTATALPPGHVRKKATGEIGRVQSLDARAGTATVLWLRQGRTSTVPLTAISRR
jgi:hypothetical protein